MQGKPGREGRNTEGEKKNPENPDWKEIWRSGWVVVRDYKVFFSVYGTAPVLDLQIKPRKELSLCQVNSGFWVRKIRKGEEEETNMDRKFGGIVEDVKISHLCDVINFAFYILKFIYY